MKIELEKAKLKIKDHEQRYLQISLQNAEQKNQEIAYDKVKQKLNNQIQGLNREKTKLINRLLKSDKKFKQEWIKK